MPQMQRQFDISSDAQATRGNIVTSCYITIICAIAYIILRLLMRMSTPGFRLLVLAAMVGSGVALWRTHSRWWIISLAMTGLLLLATFLITVNEKSEAAENEEAPTSTLTFTPRRDAIPLCLHLQKAMTFRTTRGTQLSLPAGQVTITYRLTKTPLETEPEDEPLHLITGTIRTVDERGTAWEAVTHLRGEDLVIGWGHEYAEQDNPADIPAQLFSAASQPQRQAFTTTCLLENAVDLLDDRIYRTFAVKNMKYQVQFKYSYPSITVAVLTADPKQDPIIMSLVTGLRTVNYIT